MGSFGKKSLSIHLRSAAMAEIWGQKDETGNWNSPRQKHFKVRKGSGRFGWLRKGSDFLR
jgi:hypothetical protein